MYRGPSIGTSQVTQLETCHFHPYDPVYPRVQLKNTNHPQGDYPCCGKRAFRFSPIQVGRGVWGVGQL